MARCSSRAIPTRATGRRSRISRIRCGAANIRTRSTWCSRSTARSSIFRFCIPLRPPAAMVVDTNTWKIRKEIQGIGPDMQTLAITYDGKYVVGVFSGFQRQSSGIVFIDAETDELVGIWPSNGGHHDCVIVPTKLEHLKHTRSCTL